MSNDNIVQWEAREALTAKFDITENEIRYRVEDPNLFQKDSFRYKHIGKGISLLIAKPHGKDTTETQSIRFDKAKWTPEQARTWIKKHKKTLHSEALLADVVLQNEQQDKQDTQENIDNTDLEKLICSAPERITIPCDFEFITG